MQNICKKINWLFFRWKTRFLKIIEYIWIDQETRKFIRFNENRWKRNTPIKSNSVVLVGLYNNNYNFYLNAHVTNYLAHKTGSRIETFSFFRFPSNRVKKIYLSFGAKFTLSLFTGQKFKKQAKQDAEKVFQNLKSKWDVLNISSEGLTLGDLIYDEYIRSQAVPTVDIHDPFLKDLVFRAFLILYTCREYFSTHKVQTLFADHLVYLNCGIITRVAAAHDVPIYTNVNFPEFHLIKIETNPPESFKGMTLRWPYIRYAEIFSQFSADEKNRNRLKGRELLQKRFSGQKETNIYAGMYSPYAAASPEQIFRSTSGKPRIIVLLHDFSDAPHYFRNLLLPDYYEWADFLLSRAEQTDFEWYVKPHPGAQVFEDQNLIRANNAGIDMLKNKYKKVTFLDPFTSNRQLIDEGIDAMFTACGTAGHEFAYHDIPVVNAGDNPHIAYSFNFHPRSLKEFEDLIKNADKLSTSGIRKEEVEEFVYLHFIYPQERYCGTNLLEVTSEQKYSEMTTSSEYLDHFIRISTPEKERQVAEYLTERL